MTTHRLHVLIQGFVQGVGFRYSTERQAMALGLNGWVRNLPGGEVEAEFEGPQETLAEMLNWCYSGPRFAHVTKVEADWSEGEPMYTGFHLRG